MGKRKSLLILDSAPQSEWNLKELLEEQTGRPWEIWHPNSHFSDREWRKKAKFFLFPLRLLFYRRNIDTILTYQQFYGLVFAFYYELFHLKKRCRLLISTFIYQPKQGLAGKLYFWFMRCAVNSRAVDKIVCYSASEPAYYEALFHAPKGRFVSVSLGLGDCGNDAFVPSEKRYLLAAGKSNRDYDFLVRALQNTLYEGYILCGDTVCEGAPNLHVYHNKYGRDYYEMLAACFCVVVPLWDKHISSGQLAILEAMMYAKPVLATRTDTTAEYIRDGETGFLFETEAELAAQLHLLYTQPELTRQIAQNGRRAFVQEHSLARMAEAFGTLLRQVEAQQP